MTTPSVEKLPIKAAFSARILRVGGAVDVDEAPPVPTEFPDKACVYLFHKQTSDNWLTGPCRIAFTRNNNSRRTGRPANPHRRTGF